LETDFKLKVGASQMAGKFRSLSINQAMVAGGLGANPKQMKFKDGNQRVTFSVATKKYYIPKGKHQEVEYTTWHHIVVKNPNIIAMVMRNCVKGSQVVITGELDLEKWQKKGSDIWNYKTVINAFSVQLNGKKPGAVFGAQKETPYNPTIETEAENKTGNTDASALFDPDELPY
jgi:single stranded DNA-binding protein